LVTLTEPTAIADGHLVPESGPIAWIADNHQKGVSGVPALTLHSTPDFSNAHLEEEASRWLPLLLEALEDLLEVSIIDAYGHRWRYSTPLNPSDEGAVALHPSIIVAGEVFAGAKVEGAYLSGLAAAQLALA
jgi:predicted NAD/FAD-dependent oxidoreductase